MSLFIEFHLIQNFAPSNLNRDDTGAPKEAFFGGHRRARISSQCLKRAIRSVAKEQALIPQEYDSLRTKKLKLLLEDRLTELGRTDSSRLIEIAMSNLNLHTEEDGMTTVLIFFGHREIERLAQLIHKHWDDLESVSVASEKPKDKKKQGKEKNKPAVIKKFLEDAKEILIKPKAVDVALFGRMLAEMPEINQDAACQVAHAISTHRVEREFDYFTAMDDLSSREQTGAEMIGQIEFNSATFYRYAVIDVNQLIKNLQNDQALALVGIRSFLKSIARAIPSGKQNSFAAYNPPSFIGVVLRHGTLLNLANAFEKPIWPKLDKELTSLSVESLAKQEELLSKVYGDEKDAWAALDLTGAWPKEKGNIQNNLEDLSDWVIRQVSSKVGG